MRRYRMKVSWKKIDSVAGCRLSRSEDAGGTHFRQDIRSNQGPRVVIPLRVERLFLPDFAKRSRIQRQLQIPPSASRTRKTCFSTRLFLPSISLSLSCSTKDTTKEFSLKNSTFSLYISHPDERFSTPWSKKLQIYFSRLRQSNLSS